MNRLIKMILEIELTAPQRGVLLAAILLAIAFIGFLNIVKTLGY